MGVFVLSRTEWVGVLGLACSLLACGTHSENSSGGPPGDVQSRANPVMSAKASDPCASHLSDETCVAAGAQGCHWYPYGAPCPSTGPCTKGVCQQASAGGGGSSSGGAGGGGSATCACPSGGRCYQQVGGPARPIGTEPPIECKALPSPCSAADACQCFAGALETCGAHPTIAGLCVCDNGAR